MRTTITAGTNFASRASSSRLGMMLALVPRRNASNHTNAYSGLTNVQYPPQNYQKEYIPSTTKMFPDTACVISALDQRMAAVVGQVADVLQGTPMDVTMVGRPGHMLPPDPRYVFDTLNHATNHAPDAKILLLCMSHGIPLQQGKMQLDMGNRGQALYSSQSFLKGIANAAKGSPVDMVFAACFSSIAMREAMELLPKGSLFVASAEPDKISCFDQLTYWMEHQMVSKLSAPAAKERMVSYNIALNAFAMFSRSQFDIRTYKDHGLADLSEYVSQPMMGVAGYGVYRLPDKDNVQLPQTLAQQVAEGIAMLRKDGAILNKRTMAYVLPEPTMTLKQFTSWSQRLDPQGTLNAVRRLQDEYTQQTRQGR